jgi:hypothetical protein
VKARELHFLDLGGFFIGGFFFARFFSGRGVAKGLKEGFVGLLWERAGFVAGE